MSDVLVWGVFIGVMILFTMGMGALASTSLDNMIMDKNNK